MISLEGFSASSRQMYPQLFSKILSRTAVHESLTADDVFNYLGAGWPNIILVSDPAIVREENIELLRALVDWVKHGCTMILMGFFSSTVEYDEMNKLFREHLGVKWRVAEETSHDTKLLHNIDETMIRTSSLVPDFGAKAVWLGHVPPHQTVYTAKHSNVAYAAFARVGLGKVGYIGDVNFEEEAERLIVAMCHLDRPEDYLQPEMNS